MKKSLLILALFALCALSFAYTLSIKVTVTQDTLSVGSNVSLETQGVEIASGRTGNDGTVNFSVSNGSYFAILKSTIYPKQVTLLEVNGDTAVTLTKRQQISYASAYGQIFGSTNFSGASVSATQNGRIYKQVSPDSKGFYMLSLYGLPDGTYDLVFEVPGYDKVTERAVLPMSEFIEVNAQMSVAAPPVEAQPIMTAPQQVQQSTLIEVLLTKENLPLAGEIVMVETPAGKTNLTTDSSGKASINAAQSGLYTFTFGSLTASTTVLPKQQAPAPVEPPAPAITPPPIVPVPAPQMAQQGNTIIFAGLALFFMLLFVGLLVLLIWVKAVAPALAKKKHAAAKEHAHHAAHSEAHKHEHKKASHHKKK